MGGESNKVDYLRYYSSILKPINLIQASDLPGQLSDMIKVVENGTRLVVTRNGNPVGCFLPMEDIARVERQLVIEAATDDGQLLGGPDPDVEVVSEDK